MSFFSTYPYLIESCLILALSLSSFLIMPEHRRALLVSGLVQLPAAIVASHVYVPLYWTPKVVTFPLVCLEDMIWGFSCGILIWFFAAIPFRKRLSQPGRTLAATLSRVVSFHVSCGALFAILRLTLFTTPRGLMGAALLPAVAAALVIGAFLRKELPLAIAGALGYTVFHFLDVRLGLWIWPHSLDVFQAEAALPWNPGGVPGGEVLWAACIGFAWPLIFAWIMGIRLLPAPRSTGGADALDARNLDT